MKYGLAFLFLLPFILVAQITGTVLDESNQPIVGAKIISSGGQKTLSNEVGMFHLYSVSFPDTLFISAITYVSDTLILYIAGNISIRLKSEFQEIQMVVVSAGRRSQEIEEVSISMEILRPELFNNKGATTLEEAVDQSPGVFTMDGQVSIRGGSGFAYGAGSRVLLLWNGVPFLSGDAGDAKWNAIPMENVSQIEIIKGASSVLYGSGALNGIISLTEREPGLKGETRIRLQSGVYDNPKRSSLKWWSTNPIFYQSDFYYARMLKRIGYTISMNAYSNPGYREGESEDRTRVSGSFVYRNKRIENVKAGLSYSFQLQKTGLFTIWESDSLAYTPSGSADTSNAASTLSYNQGVRFNIDPYVKLFDKKNNLHVLKTRYYYVDNANITNSDQSSLSGVLFGDYQFQKKWGSRFILTSGLTSTRTTVKSYLYGDHFSTNFSMYSQYEHKYEKLNFTGGFRLEYFEQDSNRGDSDFYLKSDSTLKIPIYPIIRLGTHYAIAKYTHLRASFGQGIRYPTVAERYTQTSVGSLNIFPNSDLKSETGWAAEIGIKQVLSIGKSWKGLMDVSGFINQYANMMEFTFGAFKPDSIQWSLNPTDPGYINKWFGFQAQNAEKARITGMELSFNSQGKIGKIDLNSLIGYTYMNPISLNKDSVYLTTFSDSNSTLLKYRFNHLFKADIEVKWKSFSIGLSSRYNSYMHNIDAIFESEILPGVSILPGLKEYRTLHKGEGALVMDARIGYNVLKHYRIGFIVNNLLNAEYMTRPGDIQAPRSYILQLQINFK